MAWLNKGNGQYFYRSKRVGGRVISEYIGAGLFGEYAETMDMAERWKRQQQRIDERQAQAAEDALDRQIDAIGIQVQALVDALLLVGGHHQHKRQWRKAKHG